MKKQLSGLLLIFPLLLIGIGNEQLSAQTFSQYVIGSSGTYATSTMGSMAWTIGEVITETYSGPGNYFTQGFHQPEVKGEALITTFFIPEGFSPNGDAINDLFVIKGLSEYPHNSIKIFNRWGDIVFEAQPYLNTWDGKSTKGLRIGGEDLPVGTYFYLFDLGNNSSILKGTIYLNR